MPFFRIIGSPCDCGTVVPLVKDYCFQTAKLIMAEKEESLVKLNVGGKMFLASSNTLRAEPASKLANLADGGGIKDESGAFFIDSCPHLFTIILNWCRFKVMAIFIHFYSFPF